MKFKKPKKARCGELMYAKVCSKLILGGQTYVFGDCVEEWPEDVKLQYRHEIRPCRPAEGAAEVEPE